MEIEIGSLIQNLMLKDSIKKSLRSLRTYNIHKIIDLRDFTSIQILGLKVNANQNQVEDLSRLIPYLASQFKEDQFNRMQITVYLHNYDFDEELREKIN